MSAPSLGHARADADDHTQPGEVSVVGRDALYTSYDGKLLVTREGVRLGEETYSYRQIEVAGFAPPESGAYRLLRRLVLGWLTLLTPLIALIAIVSTVNYAMGVAFVPEWLSFLGNVLWGIGIFLFALPAFIVLLSPILLIALFFPGGKGAATSGTTDVASELRLIVKPVKPRHSSGAYIVTYLAANRQEAYEAFRIIRSSLRAAGTWPHSRFAIPEIEEV